MPQNTQSRSWCLTLTHAEIDRQVADPPQGGTEPILNTVRDCCQAVAPVRIFVAQIEKGDTTGKLHIQAYCEFTRPVRFNRLRRAYSDLFHSLWSEDETGCIHLEQRTGPRDAAIAYCRKEETAISPPRRITYESAENPPRQSGFRSDIETYVQEIRAGRSDLELLESHGSTHLKYYRHANAVRMMMLQARSREAPTTRIFWGVTGAGKTHQVYANHAAEDIYTVMEPRQRGQIPWMDGYLGQPVIFFDEFDGWTPLTWLLKLCDKYPMRTEAKGGTTHLCPTHVYFASNKDPAQWYPDVEPGQWAAFCRRITEWKEFTAPYSAEAAPQEEQAPRFL